VFEADNVTLHDLTDAVPSITYTVHGEAATVEADFVAGCDGFHGVSRHAIPAQERREYERLYPFGWMGVALRDPRP
jgi:p-hydroxybenzoate 3-monooxygenase